VCPNAPTPKQPERQYKVGEKLSVTLHSGRIVDAIVKAIIERTDGKRLQVDYGKDETALVELLRVHRK
jgi:transcriptional regulator